MKVVNLKWEEIDDSTNIVVDVILAADVLYDNTTFEPLARGLSKFISKNVNYAIMAATVRNESTINEFLNVLGMLRTCKLHSI